MGDVAHRPGWRFYFLPPDISDDLPNLFIGHTNTLAVRSVSGHDRARYSVADHLKQFCVGMGVLLLCPSQVGTAAAAVRAQAMTERAIDAELKLARLRGLGVASIRIVIVRAARCRQKHYREQDCPSRSSQNQLYFVFSEKHALWPASTRHARGEYRCYTSLSVNIRTPSIPIQKSKITGGSAVQTLRNRGTSVTLAPHATQSNLRAYLLC